MWNSRMGQPASGQMQHCYHPRFFVWECWLHCARFARRRSRDWWSLLRTTLCTRTASSLWTRVAVCWPCHGNPTLTCWLMLLMPMVSFRLYSNCPAFHILHRPRVSGLLTTLCVCVACIEISSWFKGESECPRFSDPLTFSFFDVLPLICWVQH